MSEKEFNENLNKLIYQGGLQKHFPKNNAEKYAWNLMVDAGNFCLKDFSTNVLSNVELDCFKNYHFKNQVLLRLHHE